MGFQGTGKAKIKKFMYHTLTLHFRRCTIMMQALGEGRSRNGRRPFACVIMVPCLFPRHGGMRSATAFGEGAHLMNKSPEVEAFYVSWTWRRFRKIRLQMSGGLCEECKAKGKINAATEIHHIKELTAKNVSDPRIALSVENTIPLCAECHRAKQKRKRWRCDELGRVSI